MDNLLDILIVQRRTSVGLHLCLLFLFLIFLSVPHGMLDHSSLIRDGTYIPCIESAEVLTTGPARTSLGICSWHRIRPGFLSLHSIGLKLG